MENIIQLKINTYIRRSVTRQIRRLLNDIHMWVPDNTYAGLHDNMSMHNLRIFGFFSYDLTDVARDVFPGSYPLMQ